MLAHQLLSCFEDALLSLSDWNQVAVGWQSFGVRTLREVSSAGEVRLGAPHVIFVCNPQFNISHWFLLEQNQFALRDWPGLME